MKINDVTPALPRATLISLSVAMLRAGVSPLDSELAIAYLIGRARPVRTLKTLAENAKEAAAVVEEARGAVVLET